MATRGVNKVILIGNLGNDPKTAYMPSGGAVTNITIATSESWKDKQSGDEQTRTEWHKVVFFNKLAEIAGQFLKKGAKVYVEGSLRTRSFEKEGQKHYVTEIVADQMQMLDGRGDAAGPTHRADQPNPRPAQPAPAPSADFEDDIPF